jgi:hypothetical protein
MRDDGFKIPLKKPGFFLIWLAPAVRAQTSGLEAGRSFFVFAAQKAGLRDAVEGCPQDLAVMRACPLLPHFFSVDVPDDERVGVEVRLAMPGARPVETEGPLGDVRLRGRPRSR